MENEKILTSPAEEQVLTTKKWRNAANTASLILLVFFAMEFVAAFLSKHMAPLFVDESNEQLSKDVTKLCVYVLQYFLGVPLGILACRFTKTGKEGEKTLRLLRKPEQSAWWVFRWVIMGIGFTYCANFATTLIVNLIKLTGIELNEISMNADDTVLSRITNVVAMIILAPLFEELLMRDGYLGVLKKQSSWAAVIVTGLFFGLLHATYQQILFAAVMGVFSAFMVVKTKSIIPSIAVHMTINTIGGVLSILLTAEDMEQIQSGNGEFLMNNIHVLIIIGCELLLIFGFMGLGLLFFILEIINHKESFKLEPVHPEISEKKKLAVFFTSPLTIILVLLLLTFTVINAIPQ